MKITKYHRVALYCKGKRLTWSGSLHIGETEGKLHLALTRAGGGMSFSCQAAVCASASVTVLTGCVDLRGVAHDILFCQQDEEFTCEWVPAFLVQVDVPFVPFGTVDQLGAPVQAAYVVSGHDGAESFTVVASGREVLPNGEKTSKPVDPRPLAKVTQFPGNRVVH